MDLSSDPRLAAFLAEQSKYFAKQDLSEDQRSNTKLISYISAGVALFFLILRFWARFKRAFGYGLDDWIIVISFIFLIGNLVCVVKLVENGVGLHSGSLQLPGLMMIGKILVANEVLYVTNINLIKLSVLAMYYRFFPVRHMRNGGFVLSVISTMWNLSLILLAFLQCIPFKKIYAPWVEGNCINLKATFLAISVPSILTDIAILSLPMPYVWRLQTNLWQKLSLSAIFLLGSFVVFASIYRFIIYVRYDPTDLPYTIAPGLVWNMIELSSGIVSSCLPTLGPFIRKFVKKIGDTTMSLGSSRMKSESKTEENTSNSKQPMFSDLPNTKESSLKIPAA